MPHALNTELVGFDQQQESSFAIGEQVEVTSVIRTSESGHEYLEDKIIYIGHILARPEDKLTETTSTRKYGDDRIVSLWPTYTIDVVAKTRYTTIELLGESVSLETVDPYPPTLIVDPLSPSYSIRPYATPTVPEPRHQQ